MRGLSPITIPLSGGKSDFSSSYFNQRSRINSGLVVLFFFVYVPDGVRFLLKHHQSLQDRSQRTMHPLQDLSNGHQSEELLEPWSPEFESSPVALSYKEIGKSCQKSVVSTIDLFAALCALL